MKSRPLRVRWRFAMSTAVLAFVFGTLPISFRWQTEPAIPEDSLAELQGLRRHLGNPAKTLVVARHGLEWWVVWVLRTRIAHAKAVTPDDWLRYEAVLVLHQKRGPGLDAPKRAKGSLDSTQRSFEQYPIPSAAEVLADGPTYKLARLPRPGDRL